MNYKIIWRNLIKDKQFSFLNLLGLSTGLACALLIWLWVNDELNVDHFNKNDNQIYQVMKTSKGGDGSDLTFPTTQGLLASTMAAELPEVESASRLRPGYRSGILATESKKLNTRFAFVDQQFFKIFTYPFVDGSIQNFVSQTNSILLSDKTAKKLFNTTEQLVGKTITWETGQFAGPFIIAGVYSSPPPNATDQYDVLFNYEMFVTKEAEDIAFWGSNGHFTYLLLKKGTDIEAFNKKIENFTRQKIKQLYPDNNEMYNYEGKIFAQKYSEKYLHGNYVNGYPSGGRIAYVQLFSIIAIFLLIIASINFMNLSTAKAAGRLKEVGIKKVVGASRQSLIFQYLGESLLMAFASLLLALFFAQLLLPAFRNITGKELVFSLNSSLIVSALIITLITGLVSGSYPALYLSGFKPVAILKGKFTASPGESWIRKGLVVFQFAISVMLIVSVIVVYQQLKLIQTTNLGYNKENILSFSNAESLKKNLPAFITELKKIPGVIEAADVSGDFFGNANHSGGGISWEGKDPNIGIEYYGLSAGDGFFETMGLEIAAGRAFSNNYSDSSSVIFNEAAIKAMGIKDPIGKTVALWSKKKQIVGVVKDFHFKSLYDKVSPAFIVWSPSNENTLVKLKAGNEQQSIARIADLFAKFTGGLEFSFSFLDDDYNKLYSSEQRVAILSRYFAGIAILISCLGLFGLAAFTAQKRLKEIGIRKVIGASVTNVVTMLSKDFLVLVVIAFLIAVPVSWWAANQWLQGFAYRINITPAVFLITGLFILMITLITVSFQSIKAALSNPVKSLRSE